MPNPAPFNHQRPRAFIAVALVVIRFDSPPIDKKFLHRNLEGSFLFPAKTGDTITGLCRIILDLI